MSDKQWNGSIKEIGDKIAGLKVSEAVELGDYLEEVYKIKPAGGGVMAVAAPWRLRPGGRRPKKTEFTVVLTGFDAAKKINVIKVVREITGLGLKEAKDLVEGHPKPVKENIAKADAEKIKKQLEDGGASSRGQVVSPNVRPTRSRRPASAKSVPRGDFSSPRGLFVPRMKSADLDCTAASVVARRQTRPISPRCEGVHQGKAATLAEGTAARFDRELPCCQAVKTACNASVHSYLPASARPGEPSEISGPGASALGRSAPVLRFFEFPYDRPTSLRRPLTR